MTLEEWGDAHGLREEKQCEICPEISYLIRTRTVRVSDLEHAQKVSLNISICLVNRCLWNNCCVLVTTVCDAGGTGSCVHRVNRKLVLEYWRQKIIIIISHKS